MATDEWPIGLISLQFVNTCVTNTDTDCGIYVLSSSPFNPNSDHSDYPLIQAVMI